MLDLAKVIKPWKEAAALCDHINIYGFWNETVFLTKSGDLGMVLSIAGVDYETHTQDPSEQTVMAELQRINQALLLQLRTMQDANQVNANLALQQIVAQKQQQDSLKAGFQDAASYTNTYQAQVAPAYSGGAQALTY